MADVTGPVSTLPGALRRTPERATCDDCGMPATRRVQGETDSFGAEFFDVCDKHYAEIRAADTSGACDWCKKHAPALVPRRDLDEGMCGPVYYVCSPCVSKLNAAIEAELAYWAERDGEYGDDY